MSAPLPQKREIISAPFASQIDDIDKALFEYRYRKQTQQFNSNGNINNTQHHSNKSYGNNYHHNKFNNGAVSGGHKYHQMKKTPHRVVSPQQVGYPQNLNRQHHHRQLVQQQQQQQHQVQSNLLVQQPQPLNLSIMNASPSVFGPVASATPLSLNGNYSSVVASSPDSFVEDLIGSSNLSTSVTSASTANSGFFEFNGQKNFEVKSNNTLGLNGIDKSFNNNNSNNLNIGFNFNELSNGATNHRSEKSFGWLNIWGNDMSVWG